ncbi:DUF3857 and transglutaminase domain-containing protein [Burkholderia sp. Ac-20353]|uniref:DUF3857 domain-containing transglutaminase family protein n=1 Tax=Burkholderia sp. Ac-20353 TaxID=2703894 RepID=UPI00197B2A7F|nr:DUF3857 and transglutaminase domain-containing protein [Burkholderia sp. Ac-20353]MBN3789461.1 DUF3857 and transglutaminase domain-containing protein [Burkholderia sp. Ac-20353]
MNVSRIARYGIAALLMLRLSISFAADYQVERLDNVIKVDASGKRVVKVDLSIKLLTDAAIARFGQYALSYNAQFEKLDIDAAQTMHADGSTVPVDSERGIFDRPAPVTIAAPQFSAGHLRIVTFPALAKGDSIRLSYTLTDTDTLFPGKFSVQLSFPPIEDYRSANVTLDTPDDMPVAIDARGMRQSADASRDGRRIRSYHYETPPSGPLDEQANTVAWTDIGPVFIASNFSGYAEIAHAYHERAFDKQQPDDAIRQLADQLTNGVPDRREQATRLYAWVARNIRYVGVYFGAGPVVPHRADEVLANRYGDCKDQVTLLSALLDAKGIRSHAVLVNLGDRYRLPAAPDVLTFNHAIIWLPEFDVFADTTVGVLPFGALQFESSGKPALDTSTGKLLVTPPQNGNNSRSLLAYSVDLDRDGNATMTGDITLDGQEVQRARQMFIHVQPKRLADEMLRRFGLAGELRMRPRHLDDLDQPFSIALSGNLNQLALMPGPAAFAIPSLPNFGQIRGFADFVLQQKSKVFEGVCAGTRLEERYRITLPSDADVLAIPPDVSVRAGEIAYRSTYRREGRTVDVTRVLDRNLGSNVCSGAKLAEWADAARSISKDLKRQILYR